MSKEEIVPWINRLNAEPDGKKRNEIVAELCREKELKIGDAWRLLKEAGYDPAEAKARTGAEAWSGAVETKPATIRRKTEYPKYRCAGLVLTQRPEAYQVTGAQLEKLRCDPWVEIREEPEQK